MISIRLLVFLVLGSTALAQGNAGEDEPVPALGAPSELVVEAFRAEAGPSWRVRRDRGTGYAQLVFGGRLQPSFPPVTDADFITLAREFLVRTQALHGLDGETLAAERVVFLPLAAAFSTDKLTVRFVEQKDGVPVRGGFANVLMDSDGRLLSVDSTGLPRLAGFDVRPTLAARDAERLASSIFRAERGVFPTSIGAPRLVIAQEVLEDTKERRPALAWELELRFEEAGFRNHGALYLMAAQGPARRIAEHELYHSFDVFGTVQSLVSPGLFPDSPSNQPAAEPMAFLEVSTPAGTVFSDANGDFTLPGVNSAVLGSFRYRGPFGDANDAGGTDYVHQVLLQPNVQNAVLMNAAPTANVTAQANAFHSLGRLRSWFVGVNPADPMLDFPAVALVNGTALTCNAQFDGTATLYYVAADGCVNTAYSTVVYHEMGHFLNELYGSSNGADGFGEGAADIWAMFAADDPVVGADFSGTGSFIRSGLNTRAFCGDESQGCYGQVHADGEPLMGAFWKWRENLNATYGDAAGDLAADVLVNAWFNAFDDGQVLSIVEEHLLLLDDDDGNLANGTPNYEDLDGGFRAQGWPGFELTYIDFQNVVVPKNTRDELGPYGVGGFLTSTLTGMGAFVANAEVLYRVDGGSFASLPMSPVVGNFHTALVPGQSSPAQVELYLRVGDTLGNVQTLPRGAPDELFSFRVGVDTVHFVDTFDGPTDNGWTHVQGATQDDWQRGTPAGASGLALNVSWQDPPAAASPPSCWGNDLGLAGFNGSYQPFVDNSLFSPFIDLGGVSNAVLSFKRWLSVERGQYDGASILVNGNVVWQNPVVDHIADSAWTPVEVDVSAFADGNPATRFEFRLQSDGGLEMGGWNLDDVRVLTHGAVPSDCLFETYGSGLAGVLGVPTLDTGGQPMKFGNGAFAIRLKNGQPISGMFLFVGLAPDQVPALGGELLVLPFKSFLRPVDAFGQARLPLGIPSDDPSLAGIELYWQGFCADASLPEGFSITPAIKTTICDGS